MPAAREIVYPFTPLHRALADCALSPQLPPDALHGADRWITSIDDVVGGFSFRAHFGGDWDNVTRGTEYSYEGLRLVVRLRDDANKSASELCHWDLVDIPEFCDFSSIPTSADFIVHFSLVSSQTFTPSGRPEVSAGTLVADRTFTFNRSGASFPVQFVNFAERGWPANAVYRIEFDPEQLELPAEECVDVYLNEKLQPLYEGRDVGRSAKNQIATRLIGASVFSEVARRALTSGMLSLENRQGLGGAIYGTLCGNDSSQLAAWRARATDEPGDFAQRVADILGLADILGNVK